MSTFAIISRRAELSCMFAKLRSLSAREGRRGNGGTVSRSIGASASYRTQSTRKAFWRPARPTHASTVGVVGHIRVSLARPPIESVPAHGATGRQTIRDLWPPAIPLAVNHP
jgi:hypothetical protein